MKNANIPENPAEVRTMMQKLGISEELFTAEEFYYYYDARDWMTGGEPIRRWTSMLMCWRDNHERRFKGRYLRSKNRKQAAPVAAYNPAEKPQEAVKRDDEVKAWLECQYPMPDAEKEPEKREKVECFYRAYKIENQHLFGKYEHLKEILTKNTITMEAAARKFGQPAVERLLIAHIDLLARHFATTLDTFPLEHMQQAARWVIQKAPSLRVSEFLLILQNAHEYSAITPARLCRGDIKRLVENFPEWKRNTLQYLK